MSKEPKLPKSLQTAEPDWPVLAAAAEHKLAEVAAALDGAGITWGDNVDIPARVAGLVKHYRAALEEASVINRLGKLGVEPGDILLLRPENPMTQNQKTAFMEMLGQHVRKLDTAKPVSVVVLQPHDSLVVLRPVDLPGAPGGELAVVEEPRSRKLAPDWKEMVIEALEESLPTPGDMLDQVQKLRAEEDRLKQVAGEGVEKPEE